MGKLDTMHVGFTGTSGSMQLRQRQQLVLFMVQLADYVAELHHGDCVGADELTHELARSLWSGRCWVVLHPPDDPKARAFCKADRVMPQFDYLTRNRHIVEAVDLMIACPGTEYEVGRSGTWATVRHARRRQVPVWLIKPSGEAGLDPFSHGQRLL